MGKQIYLDKIKELFNKSPVVDFKSIERIVQVKNKNKSNYAKLLVSNLIKQGKIKTIGKGYYTLHSESSLAVFSFSPAYLGLQCALSRLEIWGQETIPVIITAKKVRRGIRTIGGANVFIRNIDKKYFFGWEFIKEGNFYLPYSDLEKTLIDMVVFNQKLDAETIKNIKLKIDKQKLKKYLKKYPPMLQKRVESFLN